MITRNAPYFKPETRPDGKKTPPSLTYSVTRAARFEEVDSLGIVWHGRYASYFEDARVALGDFYGMGYLDFLNAGLVVPIKQMGIDYVAPLRFGQNCRVSATLHWTEAAKLNMSYAITATDGALLTAGYTVQLFLTANQDLCMVKPDLYQEFCVRWENGSLPCPPACCE